MTKERLNGLLSNPEMTLESGLTMADDAERDDMPPSHCIGILRQAIKTALGDIKKMQA